MLNNKLSKTKTNISDNLSKIAIFIISNLLIVKNSLKNNSNPSLIPIEPGVIFI